MKAKASLTIPLFSLILYAFLIVSDLFRDRLLAAGGNLFLTVIILQILIFLLPTIIFCRLKGIGHATKLNIRLFSPGKLGAVIVSSLVLICGSILIRFAQIHLLGITDFSFSLFPAYRNAAPSDFLYLTMAFAVMPALAEELVFRTVLLTEYNEDGVGAIAASIALSLIAAMMCFRMEQLPILFFASLIYCLITFVTGSSVAAFLCHLLFNIYGLFGESFLLQALSNPTNRIISLFTFTLLFLILLVILFGECEHILRRMGQTGTPTPSYRLKKDKDGKTPDLSATEAEDEENAAARPSVLSEAVQRNIDVFFSPTFLLCLLVFAVMIFGFI